ncbi:globin domain-containing protein [Nocardiopsis sp. CT-R113]|uniref:Globin domain-containing protein n=1 Tax=Nocardiopsis codii TaxID=3065942 RepID=A0ABU7K075_9ACTN|nr:globin domain-containing protein [Nocardiopsis sp. CT-R113]MEE2035658.1 globin domain-containing protein [Nocardiopsis sp. CT-R113]
MQPRRITEVPLPNASVIEAVRESCASLPAGSTRLSECFYANLFVMAPDVRAMFPDDIRPQQRRMADALVEVVRYLDAPDQVAQFLRELGGRHYRELGVKPEHYPFVGRALVRAVSEVSPTWSSSMSSAWVLVYEWITATMLAGAEEAMARESGARPATGDTRAYGDQRPSGDRRSSGARHSYDSPRPSGEQRSSGARHSYDAPRPSGEQRSSGSGRSYDSPGPYGEQRPSGAQHSYDSPGPYGASQPTR